MNESQHEGKSKCQYGKSMCNDVSADQQWTRGIVLTIVPVAASTKTRCFEMLLIMVTCLNTSSVLPLVNPLSTDHDDPSCNFSWTPRPDDTNSCFGFSACSMCSAPNSNTIYVALIFWSVLVFLFYHIRWETTSMSRKGKKEKKGSMQPATSEMPSKQRFTFDNIDKIFNLRPLVIPSFKWVGNKR